MKYFSLPCAAQISFVRFFKKFGKRSNAHVLTTCYKFADFDCSWNDLALAILLEMSGKFSVHSINRIQSYHS